MAGLHQFAPKLKQRVVGIVAVVNLCVLILGWNVLISPLRAKINAAKTGQSSESERKALSNRIEATQTELKTYKSFYPAATSPSRFVDMLIQMAGANRVAILAATPSGEALKDYYKNISISLDVQAELHDLGHFIAALESVSPYIVVSNFTITNPYSAAGAPSPYGNASQVTLRTSFFLEN